MPNNAGAQASRETRPETTPGPAPREAPAGRTDYRAANLRGTDMSGLNLEHADFRGADVRDVNFTGSNLRYADFRGSDVSGANFQHASLYGAKMQGVTAFEADFRNSDLRQANFGGAYLEGSMMPPPERRPSPGEIAADAGPRDEVWRQKVGEDRRDDRGGGDAQDGQDEPDRGPPRPEEQRDQGRRRGR
jgi:Pentapeptide repeats (9 copies)/Pentapeptide repeats (8 copies)